MKKEKIIQQEISKAIRIPVIKVAYYGTDGTPFYYPESYKEVEVVDPEKLSKFLAKHVEGKDLVE